MIIRHREWGQELHFSYIVGEINDYRDAKLEQGCPKQEELPVEAVSPLKGMGLEWDSGGSGGSHSPPGPHSLSSTLPF